MKGTQLTEKHFIDLNSTKAKLVDSFIRVWQKLVYSLLQRNYLCKIRAWTSEQETCLNKPKWNNFFKYCEQKKVLLTSCINQHPRFPLKCPWYWWPQCPGRLALAGLHSLCGPWASTHPTAEWYAYQGSVALFPVVILITWPSIL